MSGPRSRPQLFDQLDDVKGARFIDGVARLELGQLPKVVDDGRHEVGFPDQAFGKPLAILGRRLTQKALGRQPKRGDGSLELVHEVGHELLPDAFQPPELGPGTSFDLTVRRWCTRWVSPSATPARSTETRLPSSVTSTRLAGSNAGSMSK